MSSMKVEELQGNVDHMSDEISVLMEAFEKLAPNDSDVCLDGGTVLSLECEPMEFEVSVLFLNIMYLKIRCLALHTTCKASI